MRVQFKAKKHNSLIDLLSERVEIVDYRLWLRILKLSAWGIRIIVYFRFLSDGILYNYNNLAAFSE